MPSPLHSPRGPPSRSRTLDLRGFLPCICALRTYHTEKGQMTTWRRIGHFVQVTRKKKKAHKSNPITVKFQGDPIFFWYQNLDTLHISLNKKKKLGAEAWNSVTQEFWKFGGFCSFDEVMLALLKFYKQWQKLFFKEPNSKTRTLWFLISRCGFLCKTSM